jgi:hypothetical protein
MQGKETDKTTTLTLPFHVYMESNVNDFIYDSTYPRRHFKGEHMH